MHSLILALALTIYAETPLERPVFACKGLSCSHPMPSIPQDLINGVDALNLEYDGLVVTSGHRCAEHNAAVGGVPGSKHLTGEAVDIDAGDNSAYTVAETARGLFSFVQVFDWGIHADIR